MVVDGYRGQSHADGFDENEQSSGQEVAGGLD